MMMIDCKMMMIDYSSGPGWSPYTKDLKTDLSHRHLGASRTKSFDLSNACLRSESKRNGNEGRAMGTTPPANHQFENQSRSHYVRQIDRQRRRPSGSREEIKREADRPTP